MDGSYGSFETVHSLMDNQIKSNHKLQGKYEAAEEMNRQVLQIREGARERAS